jgi:hypothetical protein
MKQEVSVHDRGNQRSYWRSPQPGSITSSKGAGSGITRNAPLSALSVLRKAAEMRQMMDAAAEVPLET